MVDVRPDPKPGSRSEGRTRPRRTFRKKATRKEWAAIRAEKGGPCRICAYDLELRGRQAIAALDALVAALEEAERQRDLARADAKSNLSLHNEEVYRHAMTEEERDDARAERDVVRDALRDIADVTSKPVTNEGYKDRLILAHIKAVAALAVSVDEPREEVGRAQYEAGERDDALEARFHGGTAEAVPGSGGGS